MSAPVPENQNAAHRHEEGKFNLSAWALRHQPLVIQHVRKQQVVHVTAVARHIH